MASVEELCDHITLINKSKTILEGNVQEIRMRHRSNLFEIGFTGDPAAVLLNLNGDFEQVDLVEEHGMHVIKVRANHNFSGNDILKRILPVAGIISFNEVIPSMNEVFIRVVESQHN
jgi:ABC-2 type transport system ATP-binding protein